MKGAVVEIDRAIPEKASDTRETFEDLAPANSLDCHIQMSGEADEFLADANLGEILIDEEHVCKSTDERFLRCIITGDTEAAGQDRGFKGFDVLVALLVFR